MSKEIIELIHVDESICLESYPCQHYVKVKYIDNSISNRTMLAPTIYELCKKHCYTLTNPQHFACYSTQHIKQPVHNLSNSTQNILFKDVLEHGKYYNPANSHYQNVNAIVMCDKCDKVLNTCIGYKNADLCLKCVYEMTK